MHIKLAAQLGLLVARANCAALFPSIETKLGAWANTPEEDKQLLLGLSDLFGQDCISRYTISE